MDIIQEYEKTMLDKKIPEFNPGDTIRVHSKIEEGGKIRVQKFEGTVLQKRNSGIRKTVTVRKITQGIGVERIFPLYSPNIVKIEVIRRGKVRRARLFYLRGRKGKTSRIKEKR